MFLAYAGLRVRSMDKKRFKGTLLTDRQWDVLTLRSSGLTQSEVASKLNTTRENISILEGRVYRKIKAAKATLAALENLSTKNEVVIPTGTDLFEAVLMILVRADVLGVKLKITSDAILATVRSKCRGKIRGHHLTAVVTVRINEDGTIVIR